MMGQRLSTLWHAFQDVALMAMDLPEEEEDRILELLKRIVNGEECEKEVCELRILSDDYVSKRSKELDIECFSNGLADIESDAYRRGYLDGKDSSYGLETAIAVAFGSELRDAWPS